jgi:hypothetical protein
MERAIRPRRPTSPKFMGRFISIPAFLRTLRPMRYPALDSIRDCFGCAVLFPHGSIHMLQNTGDTVMKIVCFFAPPSDLSTDRFFDDIHFPE